MTKTIMNQVRSLKFSLVMLCAVMSFALTHTAQAKPLAYDQPYQGPVRLDVKELGLAFKLPKGWRGMAPSSGEGFIATHGEGIQVVIAPAPHPMSQLKQELTRGSQIAPGLYLTPKGKLKEMKDGSIGGEFGLAGAEQAKIYAYAKPIKNRMPVVTLAVCIEKKKKCRSFAKRFLKSIKSIAKSKPKRQRPRGALAASLANKRLSRYYHGSGYSEKSTMTLCADGRYYSSFNASSVSINGTGAMNSDGAGQWSVRGKTLTVKDAGGSTKRFQIQLTSDQLLLNQERWLREDYTCR